MQHTKATILRQCYYNLDGKYVKFYYVHPQITFLNATYFSFRYFIDIYIYILSTRLCSHPVWTVVIKNQNAIGQRKMYMNIEFEEALIILMYKLFLLLKKVTNAMLKF